MRYSIEKRAKGIAKILSCVKNESQLAIVLEELLTPIEIDKIHERIRVITCLKDGLSQRQTAKKSGAAIATVNRGARLFRKKSLIIDKVIGGANRSIWWKKLFWQT